MGGGAPCRGCDREGKGNEVQLELEMRVLVVASRPDCAMDYRRALCPARDGEQGSARHDLVEDLFGAALGHEGLPDFAMTACRDIAEAADQLRDGIAERRPFALVVVDHAGAVTAEAAAQLKHLRAVDQELAIVVVAAGLDLHPVELSRALPPADRLIFLHRPFHPAALQQLALALTARRGGARAMQRTPRDTRPTDLADSIEALPIAALAFAVDDRLQTANEAARRLFPEIADLLVPGAGYAEIQTGMARRLLSEGTLYRQNAWLADRLRWHAGGGGALDLRLTGGRSVLMVESRRESGEICCLFHDVSELKQREASRARTARLTQMSQAFGALCEILRFDHGAISAGEADGKVVRLRPGTAGRAGGDLGLGAGERAGLAEKLEAVAQRQRLNPGAHRVDQVIAPLIDRAGGLLPDAVEVELVTRPGLWNAHVDAPRLRVVIEELIRNACEAMAGRGRLTAEINNLHRARDDSGLRSGSAPGDYVRLSLRDSGEGLTPELAERALNPFFSTGSGRGRLGLGLSMAHGFASQSGGWIDIAPREGGGAVVDLYLPRARRMSAIGPAGAAGAGSPD